MEGLIIFKIAESSYAIDINSVQRIVQATELTPIPNSNDLIDGMMSYEDSVIKVLNFRKLVNTQTYDEYLIELFNSLKLQHKEWIDALKNSVRTSTAFQKTTDPHVCELGKWIGNFTSYDDNISDILKNLNSYHKALHVSAIEVLDVAKSDNQKAIELIETKVQDIYNHTMGYIDTFIAQFSQVADSLQKLLFYSNGVQRFAIKVDEIIDIAHVESSKIDSAKDESSISEYLDILGVIELNGTLVNIIKDVRLPQ
jgi:chemotaxis signal transduction protein